MDISGNTSNVQITNNSIEWNGDSWSYAHNVSIFSEGGDLRDVTVASTAGERDAVR